MAYRRSRWSVWQREVRMRPDGKPVLSRSPRSSSWMMARASRGYPRHRPASHFASAPDGDLQMLQWTAAGAGARFAAIVHHTDGEREWVGDKP